MPDDMEDMAGSDGVSVHSGFPNPAADRRHGPGLALDINRLLVRQPSSTYLFRIAGHHWAALGLYDGDVAVIDKALDAKTSDLVVAWQGGEARLRRRYQLSREEEVWGVVTAIIHQLRRP